MAIGAGSGAISSEIVGYVTSETFVGNQTSGVAFVPVAGEGKMSDLTVSGYSGEYLDNGISCGKLDTYGRSIARMYWIDAEEFTDPDTGDYWPAQHGWYSDDGVTDYNNLTLSPGEGLWVNVTDSSLKIQSAGKVLSSSIQINLANGNQLIANPTPVTVTMGDVWVAGYTGEYMDNGVSCGKLDTYGRSIARMYWIEADEFTDPDTGDYWPAQYGWYSDDGETEYNNVTLNPGESVWLNNIEEDFSIHFPSPLAE